ncbi:MAG: ribosome maturation factor RimP [Trueperaceae bacterium]
MDLAHAAEEVLAPLGYDLLEATVIRKGRSLRVLVRIDRVDEAPVTVEDVRIASETVGLELDRLDPFDGAYQLEVESPGPTRPLRTARQFERFVDLRAKVKTADRAFTGIVRGVDGNAVRFEVDGETWELDLHDAWTARLAEWPDRPR